MAKEPEFGRPKIDAEQASIPEFLRGREKTARVLKNADVTDYVWLGDDGKDEFIPPPDPKLLFRAVLKAIIDAHPLEKPSPGSRLDSAMKALLGTNPSPGPKLNQWYERPLEQMAEEYLAGFYGLKPAHTSADALAWYVLQQDPDFSSWSVEQQESRKKTLRDKFKDRKEALLVQFSTANHDEVRAAKAGVEAVISALKRIGINVADHEDSDGN